MWFSCDSAVEELLAGTPRADVFTALGWQPQDLLWLQLGWWSLIHPSWSLPVPQVTHFQLEASLDLLEGLFVL